MTVIDGEFYPHLCMVSQLLHSLCRSAALQTLYTFVCVVAAMTNFFPLTCSESLGSGITTVNQVPMYVASHGMKSDGIIGLES